MSRSQILIRTSVAIVLFACAKVVMPQSLPVITQLTDNQYDDVTPRVSGDNLVWRGFDGNDWEIFQRQGALNVPLTDNSLDDGNYVNDNPNFAPYNSRLAVAENHVAWAGYDGNDYELFLYDGLTTTQVTHNGFLDEVAADGLSDGRVAFTTAETRDGSGGTYDVNLYDGTSIRSIAGAEIGSLPSMSGDVITWTSSHSGNFTELRPFVYDGTQVRQVSDSGIAYASIAAGRRVVWGAEGNDKVGLYIYDVDTRITELHTVIPDYNSGVRAVDGDRVLYNSRDDGDSELYVYDITTRQSTRLTDNDVDDVGASIFGDLVVWEATDGNDREIYLYDLVSGQTLQLTDNLIADRNPQISGTLVVWQAFDGNDWEIYQYGAAVPEPSTSLLLLLGVASLVWHRSCRGAD